MPFSYEQIEDEVVTRLQTTLAAYAVTIPLPDTQSQEDENIRSATSAKKSLIVVYYDNSGFDPSSTTNYARQQETMEIVCNVRSTKRRGENGIMKMLQLIKLCLQGYIPQNASRMFLKEIKLVDRDSDAGIFSYNISFSSSKLHIQNFIDGPDLEGAILQEVTWQDESYNGQPAGINGEFNASEFSSDFNIGIAS